MQLTSKVAIRPTKRNDRERKNTNVQKARQTSRYSFACFPRYAKFPSFSAARGVTLSTAQIPMTRYVKRMKDTRLMVALSHSSLPDQSNICVA